MRELNPAGDTERETALAINQLIRGRNNAVGTVTLTPSATTTAVPRSTMSLSGGVFLFPATESARVAWPNTKVLLADRTSAGFVITHASNAAIDQTFYYAVLGG